DVLSSLMDSDDESVTMASKPKLVIPLGNGADGSSGVTTGEKSNHSSTSPAPFNVIMMMIVYQICDDE
ncbi:hypothetical protein Tco_0686210, partial [Tanacetum coccineum]